MTTTIFAVGWFSRNRSASKALGSSRSSDTTASSTVSSKRTCDLLSNHNALRMGATPTEFSLPVYLRTRFPYNTFAKGSMVSCHVMAMMRTHGSYLNPMFQTCGTTAPGIRPSWNKSMRQKHAEKLFIAYRTADLFQDRTGLTVEHEVVFHGPGVPIEAGLVWYGTGHAHTDST